MILCVSQTYRDMTTNWPLCGFHYKKGPFPVLTIYYLYLLANPGSSWPSDASCSSTGVHRSDLQLMLKCCLWTTTQRLTQSSPLDLSQSRGTQLHRVHLDLHLPDGLCVGSHHSSLPTINTGAPQGCLPCPMLYFLYTHDCVVLSCWPLGKESPSASVPHLINVYLFYLFYLLAGFFYVLVWDRLNIALCVNM